MLIVKKYSSLQRYNIFLTSKRFFSVPPLGYLWVNSGFTHIKNTPSRRGLVGTWTAISYIVLISFLY